VPLAVGEAEAEAVGGWNRCRNACWLIDVEWELDTAKTTPRVTPSATGMARGIAMRIVRLRRLRRRDADLCMVSINLPPCPLLGSRGITLDQVVVGNSEIRKILHRSCAAVMLKKILQTPNVPDSTPGNGRYLIVIPGGRLSGRPAL
jgi:hypothetical protein